SASPPLSRLKRQGALWPLMRRLSACYLPSQTIAVSISRTATSSCSGGRLGRWTVGLRAYAPRGLVRPLALGGLLQQHRSQCQCPHVLLHLVVVTRPPVGGLAVGEIALITPDATDQLCDHVLTGHAR